MAFRSIVIENPAKLSIRKSQLVIDTGAEASFPVEDLYSVMIESNRVTLSSAVLSSLSESKCTLFVCDKHHLPSAVLMPFASHNRNLEVIEKQLEMTEPLKKRIWKSIVQSKIKNQALCLEYVGNNDGADYLRKLVKTVKSGDIGNVEAVAAQHYFPALFGAKFFRSQENGINSALNYGYAILRGLIARNLVSHGFLPMLGIHHKNKLNQFNLADDLMEPFRPLIDLLVFRMHTEEMELNSKIKHDIYNFVNLDILSGDHHQSVSYALTLLVQSFSRSVSTGISELCLPTLLELEQHRYE